MTNFSKNEDCPTSQSLLDFQNGDVMPEEGRLIRAHMRQCEFCSAEVAFYAHYPQPDEVVEPVKIPAPLYELAEALLTSKPLNIDSLDDLLNEREMAGG